MTFKMLIMIMLLFLSALVPATKKMFIAAAQTDVPDAVYLTRLHQQMLQARREDAEGATENEAVMEEAVEVEVAPAMSLFEQGLFDLGRGASRGHGAGLCGSSVFVSF